jgi:glycosyltransferase involved in cell wall biosynthesis
MKRLILILCIPFILAATEEPPLIVTALMIKNEAHSVVDTLEPLVKGGITAYLIYDTGSTDGTLEIVHDYFKKHPEAKAVVKQEPFVDFAVSRNHAFDLAKEAFPKAEFILMPDAEWLLQNVPGLIQFCQKERHSPAPNYMIRVIGGSLDYYSTRLTRADGVSRYVGKVHEVVMPATSIKAPENIYFDQRSYTKGVAQSKERWKRDRKLLEQAFFGNPSDPRTLFYLAQTCACLEDYQAAYQYYRIRTLLNGWDEENYMAYFRLGGVIEHLAESNPTLIHEAISTYLEAYNMRPTRAEPLIKLAGLYLKQEKYALSYFFAEKASHIEYPAKDILFVEKYMYDFVRYDILSQCAWYVNQKEVGYEAIKKAITYDPNSEYLRKNLTFYEPK